MQTKRSRSTGTIPAGRITAFLCALILLGALTAVGAGVPQVVNFQGVLLDSAGKAIPDADYSVSFRLWDDEATGSQLWEERQTVAVEGGVFNVLLGQDVAIPLTALEVSSLWIEVKLEENSEPYAPRTRAATVFYAFSAERAGTADTAAVAVSVADDGVTSSAIKSGEILLSHLGRNGALPNQIIQWGGSGWVLADPPSVSEGGGVSTVTGTGGIDASPVDGDVVVSIAADGVTLGTIADGAVDSDEIADEAVQFRHIKSLPPGSTGMVIKWDGAAWGAGVDEKNPAGGNDDGDWTISGDNLISTPNGNVGIGTNTPDQKLDVNGTVEMTGFKMATGAADKSILTSDADGKGTWEVAGSLGDGITSVTVGDGLSKSGTADSVHLDVVLGTGLEFDNNAVQLADNAVDSTKIANRSITFADIASNGATTDGQIMKWKAGAWILDADQIGNAGAGDIMSVNAGPGLSGGAIAGDADLNVNVGTGLEIRDDTVGVASSGINTDQLADGAVTTVKMLPDVISSINGVSNDGGGISLVEGANITITPNDGANTITIAATGSGSDADWTVAGNDMFSAVSGRVGIGTSTPAAKLHLDLGGATLPGPVSDGIVISGGSPNLSIISPSTGTGEIKFGDQVHDAMGRIKYDHAGDEMTIWAGNSGILAMRGAAVDVNGTMSVSGNLSMAGFKMTTGGSSGLVLTSDATGVGTWQPAVGGGSSWLQSGSVLLTDGMLGLARAGNTLYGIFDSTHINLGVASTTGTSGSNRAFATVGGGYNNTASGSGSTVAGGQTNTSSSSRSTVGGGTNNQATGEESTVSGGLFNTAAGVESSVGGGSSNEATSGNATVGGGKNNTAGGAYSTVPGGRDNSATGSYSFAAGHKAKALHDGTFVWADQASPDFNSTDSNQFLIRARGGVGIGIDNPDGQLDVVTGAAHAAKFLNNYSSSGIGVAAATVRIENTNASGIGQYTICNTSDAAAVITNASAGVGIVLKCFAGPSYINALVVRTNGRVGLGTVNPNYKLDVRGTIGNNGTQYHSDRRWKQNIRSLPHALDMITHLRGVSYSWRREQFPEMGFSEGERIGLVAQEVEQVLPQLVHTGDDGFKSVEYANLVAVLIEAVKEQQGQIDSQQRQIDDLKSELDQIKR